MALLAGACVGVGGDGSEPAGPGESTSTSVRRTTAAEAPLDQGACGDVPRLQVGGALDPATFVAVDCAVPHTVEIGPVLAYPAGDGIDFPGTAAVDGYATSECLERFEPYVGADYQASTFDVLIVAPDEDGWDDGDRRIACILYQVDFQPITGPVAASGR